MDFNRDIFFICWRDYEIFVLYWTHLLISFVTLIDFQMERSHLSWHMVVLLCCWIGLLILCWGILPLHEEYWSVVFSSCDVCLALVLTKYLIEQLRKCSSYVFFSFPERICKGLLLFFKCLIEFTSETICVWLFWGRV